MTANAATANSFLPSLSMPDLSGVFNFAAKALKWTALLFIGAILTEPLIFALVHANAGGMATMAALNPTFQGFFDWSGITEGLHHVAEWLGGGASSMASNAGAQLVNSSAGNMFIPPIPR